jgi:hypothetical protein
VKITKPTPGQLAARKTLEDALREHQHLDAIEMCAVVSHFLGQLIALQDQTKYTPAQVMHLVSENIEQGNAEVIQSLLNGEGGRA